jgi:hypothetical protein
MKVQIIDNYDRLSVGKYQQLAAIDTGDDIERSVQTLEILTGLGRDDLLSLPVDGYTELTRHAQFLNSAPALRPSVSSFIAKDGTELRVQSDPSKMTAGQYIDYQQLIGEAGDHIVEVLSVFLIPKGKRYMDGYDIGDVQRIIRDEMPVSVAMGMLGSFLYRLGRSLRASLTFSAWKIRQAAKREEDKEKAEKMKATARQMKEAVRSLRGGDGWRALTLLASVQETAGIASIE